MHWCRNTKRGPSEGLNKTISSLELPLEEVAALEHFENPKALEKISSENMADDPLVGLSLSQTLRFEAIVCELEKLRIQMETLEVAREIADSSDVVGIEVSVVEFLVRATILVDRQGRAISL